MDRVLAYLSISAKPSVLIFCGIPLASRAIGQRIAGFGSFLAKRGWHVRLSAVDARFDSSPFAVRDSYSGMDVEVIGKTHYDIDDQGRQVVRSPIEYLRECREITGRIMQMASEMSADHILLSTTMPAPLIAAMTLRKRYPSVWLDIDDWTSGQFVAGGGGRAGGFGYSLFERTLPHLAHHITVCSSYLQRLFPRATYIPNFIREEDIFERSDEPKPAGPVKVAFAGVLTGYYGQAELLEEIVARRSELANVELSILGDGPSMGACRAIVERGKIGELVHFAGQLSRSDVMSQLARSDIGVLPLGNRRHDRARFPLKLLDYLASGCAVAASNTGMAREILTAGKSGMLSEPANMESLVDDVLVLAESPDLRAHLATEGRALLPRYYADTVCEDWMRAITTASGRQSSLSRS